MTVNGNGKKGELVGSEKTNLVRRITVAEIRYHAQIVKAVRKSGGTETPHIVDIVPLGDDVVVSGYDAVFVSSFVYSTDAIECAFSLGRVECVLK